MPRKKSGVTQNNAYLRNLMVLMLKAIGHKHEPSTDKEFIDMADEINEKLGSLSSIGESTLKRLFRKEKYEKSFDISSTLNPLAKLAGYSSWISYLQEAGVKNLMLPEPEMEMFYPADIFNDAEEVNIDAILRMGWFPNRYVEVKYLGNCEFEILKYVGTGSDRTGEVVTARWFEVVDLEEADQKNGMVNDIAGILGGEIEDRFFL